MKKSGFFFCPIWGILLSKAIIRTSFSNKKVRHCSDINEIFLAFFIISKKNLKFFFRVLLNLIFSGNFISQQFWLNISLNKKSKNMILNK